MNKLALQLICNANLNRQKYNSNDNSNNNNNNNNHHHHHHHHQIIKCKWSNTKPIVNLLNKKGDLMLFCDKKQILALASSNQVYETDMSSSLYCPPCTSHELRMLCRW